MGKMDIKGTATQTMSIPKFDGVNTALAFTEIKNTESLEMMNALPGSLGSIAKRPGSIPVSDTLANPIKHLFNYRQSKVDNLYATSNNKLYYLDGSTLVEQTGTLNSTEIDNAQFKDETGSDVMILADGGDLKYFDGTEVKAITPAADDGDPNPANDLANINANNPPIGCLVHGARVVIWDGSDTIWHSKVGYYDYFPSTDYIRFVRKGDYVQTCVTYRGALLVMLRNSIAVLFGSDIDTWKQDFLATEDGCISPNTVQQVTFPDGRQEIFYASDNGVFSVYTLDTVLIDRESKYSTRDLTRTQIDWDKLGVTKEEWKRSTAYFHDSKYWLIYPKGNEWHGLVYDLTFENWFPIKDIDAQAFFNNEDEFYYASESGNIRVLREDLYSDWDDTAKTTGTPINTYWYSNLLTPGITGYDHFWDIVIIEAKQHQERSTVDIEVNTYNEKMILNNQLKTEILTWGESRWGESVWPSQNLTHYVNYAHRIRCFQKGKYLQMAIKNDRDEPIEVYNITLEVRPMQKY